MALSAAEERLAVPSVRVEPEALTYAMRGKVSLDALTIQTRDGVSVPDGGPSQHMMGEGSPMRRR